jgi:hypothetical protein
MWVLLFLLKRVLFLFIIWSFLNQIIYIFSQSIITIFSFLMFWRRRRNNIFLNYFIIFTWLNLLYFWFYLLNFLLRRLKILILIDFRNILYTFSIKFWFLFLWYNLLRLTFYNNLFLFLFIIWFQFNYCFMKRNSILDHSVGIDLIMHIAFD